MNANDQLAWGNADRLWGSLTFLTLYDYSLSRLRTKVALLDQASVLHQTTTRHDESHAQVSSVTMHRMYVFS